MDQRCDENFPKHFTEKSLLPFLIKDAKAHPRQISGYYVNAGSQFQLQITSVVSNPNFENAEILESISPIEVTEISPPTCSSLTPGINIPLHFPATIRSASDSQNDPGIRKVSASKDNPVWCRISFGKYCNPAIFAM